MGKNFGPKGFEKAWVKALNGFSETKMFFNHGRSQTTINYIDGDKLLGVEMYRCQFEIDQWLGHFQHYLDTGVFDTNAYWVEYKSVRNEDTTLGTLTHKYDTEVHGVPMELRGKLWSVHSSEMNKFMKDERAVKGDIGFKRVSRPEDKK